MKNHSPHLQGFSLACIVAVAAVFPAHPALAGTTINIEAVSDYRSMTPPCADNDQPNAIANATGFRDMMLWSNVYGYTQGQTWYNGYVWGTDFTDPQRVSGGQDWQYFDAPATAISYFAGHGLVPAGEASTWQQCTSAATCAGYTLDNPPPGAQTPRVCRTEVGDPLGKGRCVYTSLDRAIVTTGPTCSIANYSSCAVAWGEQFNWANAGTNGGANVVALSISFAHRTNFAHELFPAFAGVHMILSPINHCCGDTGDFPYRGYWFAHQYYLFPWKSVIQSWNDAGAAVGPSGCPPTSAGSCCGWGINGCGGHVGLVMGSTSSNSFNHFNEDWSGIQSNTNDGLGNSHFHSFMSCNWDCAARGLSQ